MRFIQTNTHLESSLLSGIPLVKHGFSLASQGDMRNTIVQNAFLATLGIPSPFFRPKQVHGTHIVVNPMDLDSDVEGDGVVVFRGNTTIESIGVVVGDCVPILAADMQGRIIAAIHAGWKGALGGIIREMVHTLSSGNIHTSDLLVAIGPHIGACCYTVSEDRIALCKEAYPNISDYAYNTEGVWHLDIGKIILMQLQELGFMTDHIDTNIFCTSCQKNSFFSFRGQKKEEFGEMLAVISFNKGVI